jgi:EPS-associated MarR family transcriptional regulator
MTEHPIKEDILRILRILASNDGLTQRNLATYLGISLGKTNYLVKALAQKGLIKMRNFTQHGEKLKKVKYILTKRGLDEKLKLTFHFLQTKEKEYLELKKEVENLPDSSNINPEKEKV